MYDIQKQININEKYNQNFENIYNAIYNNNIDKLIQLIDELIKNKNNKYKYLDYLLNPNIYKYVKIPNNFPLSTVTFQLHNIIKTKTNAKGNIGILFNPFFYILIHYIIILQFQIIRIFIIIMVHVIISII